MTGERLTALTTLAAALLLAGCTGGDTTPSQTPTPTETAAAASASPSASPSATALSDEELLAMMPAGAERADLGGAAVVAQFWLESYSAAFESGNTSIIRSLGSEDCEYCAGQADAIDNAFADGWSLQGGQLDLQMESFKTSMNDDGFAYVAVLCDAESIASVSPEGVVSQVEPAEQWYWALQMVNDRGTWKVNGVEVSAP